MTNHSIALALASLRPGAEYTLVGDTLAGITWLDGVLTQPADVDIEAEILVVEAQLAATAYLEERAVAYASQGLTPSAMIEALWQKTMESYTATADAMQVIRTQIKNEYPTPEEA